ncbi:MAG: hypothetical protein KJN94_06410 [Gammaproteobacteria bacterium]|nr:hypothetical protein [Gammaproteobacteria bacterium]
MLECRLKRYAAYFRGWCQAFGEHEGIHVEEDGIDWLLADSQVGLVLPRPMIKPLYREVLLHEEAPPLTFSLNGVQIGSLEFPLANQREVEALDAMENLMKAGRDCHLFLTSHLLYGGGNRIITFSCKKPLAIIYKEIGTMRIRLEPASGSGGPCGDVELEPGALV